MDRFVRLYRELDQSTRTRDKVEALAAYFRDAAEADRIWAIALFTHRRPRRALTLRQLREWAAGLAGVPDWLFEASYQVAGDLAETIALLLPARDAPRDERGLSEWIAFIRGLAGHDPAVQREQVEAAWRAMDPPTCLVFNKLITGGFRAGVSAGLVTRALAGVCGQPAHVITHLLMGQWDPDTLRWEQLLAGDTAGDVSRPYPFCLAHPLEGPAAELGRAEDWLAEYKWDGIRAQLIRRGDGVFLWSRGGELVGESFPELVEAGRSLPDGTVLDGEILVWEEDRPAPFGRLQKRLGRRAPGPALRRSHPARLLVFDCLEAEGVDLRRRSLRERRDVLDALMANQAGSALLASAAVAGDWAVRSRARDQARERGVEGLMLKRLDSPYHSGRLRGDWWKWKVDPYTIDAVLVYGQAGHGRRANLFTDYTFALWSEGVLVPFAKAYSGLNDAEILEVDRFIRRHTEERFGPVRRVVPALVFELAFEGLQVSGRHKSGVAVRFPRILRWRRDKTPDQADTLEDLKALMPA